MNAIKSEQLGMSFGKAGNILRKNIMFSLVEKCEMNTCYRCGEKIESVDDMSIEHKENWLHSENPVELFFDIDNIAFSHSNCNSANKRIRRDLCFSSVGLKGVTDTKDKNRKKPYKAHSYLNGKVKYIGYFETPEEAGMAYDKFVIETFGEDTPTNRSLGLLKY